jgi:hypothetical protein
MVTMGEALSASDLADHCKYRSRLSSVILTEQIKEVLERLATESNASREMAKSIAERESRLEIHEWGSLFDALLEGGAPVTISLREWARAHLLRAAKCETEPPLGRVISEEDLIRIIVRECVLSEPVVRTAVGMLLEDLGEEWRHGVQFLRDCVNPTRSMLWRPAPIGRYVMWGTWVRGSTNPFLGLRDDQVEAALGLQPQVGRTVIAMTYNLPLGMSGQFPTIAEASASDPWNEMFRPSVSTAKCGLTEPVPGYGISDGRLEVVHPPVEVDMLVEPLRILDNWLVP